MVSKICAFCVKLSNLKEVQLISRLWEPENYLLKASRGCVISDSNLKILLVMSQKSADMSSVNCGHFAIITQIKYGQILLNTGTMSLSTVFCPSRKPYSQPFKFNHFIQTPVIVDICKGQFLPVQATDSHIRKLPSLIRTVFCHLCAVIRLTFSLNLKKNGRQLFYIYSVTADGIGSLASIADYFGKE